MAKVSDNDPDPNLHRQLDPGRGFIAMLPLIDAA
jgi:hypothetical protein